MSQATRRNGPAPMLRDSVERIWLAGLGALALTEQEGGKLFKTLVKRGEGFERQTKSQLRKAVTAARDVPGAAMARIEESVDDTMSAVLRRMGVPTKREITSLTRRVEGLASTLERSPARARRTAKRTAPATARARKAAAPTA